MNIIFICSCLEPGKDGVGDYTRKLATALIKHGLHSRIIALNDRRLNSETWSGEQCDNKTTINVLRLSSTISWKKRLKLAKKYIHDFDPTFISLQYVPFGYQIKGLPFKLARNLKQVSKKNQWTIMFHELSVNKDESLKFKLWAFLQVYIIKSLLKKLKPAFVATNTKIYQVRLAQMGYPTHILPVFSNIDKVHINKIYVPNKSLVPDYIQTNRSDFIIGTLFGSFSSRTWDLQSLLNLYLRTATKKKLVIASIGRMSYGDEQWAMLEKEFPDIIFLTLGIQDASFISYWLSCYTDFGILSTLPELATKSGSFMAFKQHGLPVVCKGKTIELDHYHVALDPALISVNDLKHFGIPPKYLPVSVLDEVADDFIAHVKKRSDLSLI